MAQTVKNPPAMWETSVPSVGRSPGGERGNPLQYSCLENPHGQKNLAGYIPWGCKELGTTEGLSTAEHRKRLSDLVQVGKELKNLVRRHPVNNGNLVGSPAVWLMTKCSGCISQGPIELQSGRLYRAGGPWAESSGPDASWPYRQAGAGNKGSL